MSDQITAAVAALSESAHQAFQLLGLHPAARPWPIGAAAELLDISHADVNELIAELTAHHLIDEPLPGRYRFPPLLAEHARSSAAELPEPTRRQAIARMATWYVMQAGAAEYARNPHRRMMSWQINASHELAAAAVAHLVSDDARAITGMSYETGLYELAYAAGEAYWGWLQARHAHPQWEDICNISIAAARELGDDVRRARMMSLHSTALRDADDVDGAAASVEESMRLATQAGDQLGRATAYEQRAHLLRAAARYDEAIAACQSALAIYERFGGLHRSLGLVCRLTGDIHTQALLAGHADDAGDHALASHGRALDHFQRINDVNQIGRTMIAMSEVRRAIGQHREAVIEAQGAVERLAPLGKTMTMGHALVALAEAWAAQGESNGDADCARPARDSLAEAARTYEHLGLRAGHPTLRRVKDLAVRVGLDEGDDGQDDDEAGEPGPH